MTSRRGFYLGTAHTLFNDCSEYFDDGNDSLLVQAYNSVEKEIKIKSELYDGSDSYLNKIYDEFEKSVPRSNNKSLIPQNMLKYVQCSEQHIEKKQLIARMKLRERVGGNYFKNLLSESFWPVEEWPTYIIKLLFTKTFSYGERIALAAFYHGNGFKDALTAQLIFQFYNNNWNSWPTWNRKFYRFKQLFEYLEKAFKPWDPEHERIKCTYWYYDLRARQTMFYDGYVRTAKGEKNNFIQFNRYN